VFYSGVLFSNNDSTTFETWQKTHLKNIVFTENLGQFKTSDGKPSPNLLFKAEAQGLTIYLTTKGLTYFFVKQKPQSSKLSSSNDSLEFQYDRFDIDLQNATIKKENIAKEGASDAFSNYIYPHCKQGISSVKEYSKLTIKNVYPGIDWILYNSNDKGLKYDFIVHSGADANQISFLYKTLNQVSLKDGNINLSTSFCKFIDSSPECFLQKNHSAINSNYIIKSASKKSRLSNTFYETEIAFNVANYSNTETLIIDPLQLWWGTYYGGTSGSQGTSVTTDSIGNLYVLGNTNSVDFPLQTYGSLAYFQGTYGGSNGGSFGDIFILKFTNLGKLLWATYIGGNFIEKGTSIKCDKNGDIFVLGETSSIDMPLKKYGSSAYFDSVMGVVTPVSSLYDLFLSKFSSNGQYLWGTFYGGDINETGQEISIDNMNNVYFTGGTNSLNFPVFDPGGGSFFQGTNGSALLYVGDGVILKFSNTGQRLLASYFGGNQDDQILSTACDKFGNVYFCGHTASTNLFMLDAGGGAFYQPIHTPGAGIYNGFILKFNSSAQAVWSTYISALDGICNSIVCDRSGNLFMTGRFTGTFPTIDPGGGAFFLGSSFNTRMIIAKFNPLSQMVWGTFYGTFSTSGFSKLTLGACDEIYTTFAQSTFCVGCPPMQIMNPGNGAYFDSTYNNDLALGTPDIYIAAFSNSGALKWGTYFGGIGNDQTMIMTCDKFGNIFYTGSQGYDNYNASSFYTYTTTCIKNPGGGAYYQQVPKPITSGTAYYGVIGKFTSPYTPINLTATGCNISDTLEVNAFSGWSPYTYNWSNGDTTNYLTNVPIGTYTCTVTDDFFGCKQEKIIYFGPPSISISLLNDSICLNQSMLLNAHGADIYNWFPDGSLNSLSGSTVIATPSVTTTYTVTGTTLANCTSTNTVTLVVNSLPIVSLNGLDSICKGNYSVIQATGASNYTWSPSLGLSATTGFSVNANPNQTQVYTVIGADNNHCLDTVLFTLNIIPLPQLQVLGSQSVCIGSTATLTALGATQFNWNFGSIQSSNPIAIVSPSINTTYTLTGTNLGKCKDSLYFTINVLQLPTISIVSIDSICDGQDFSLQAIGSGSFNWYPSIGLSCTQCSNPISILESSTQYYVTITDNNLCSNIDSVFINVKETCGDDLLIPNVFSPNGDGVNDFFKVTVSNIRSFECDIYDRWGIKLFSSSLSNFSWNGISTNGVLVPDGVYFYLIRIQKYNNKINNYKGFLTLVR
jgi:gliding motility-associated-like protein